MNSFPFSSGNGASDSTTHQFVSGSHDQTLVIWKWDEKTNAIKRAIVCKDHDGSVDCVTINANNTLVSECSCCCCLPTPLTFASAGSVQSSACGPPASFSVHLASSACTPAGSVHKSRCDNVVHMWVQLKR